MITPLQSSAATVSKTLLQSILDSSQQRQAEKEARNKSSSTQDEMLKARIAASKSHAALNDKINAHFFGSQAHEESPLEKLAGRFISALGMKRQDGELDTDYGQRIKDGLYFMDRIGLDEALRAVKQGPSQELTLKRFGVKAADIRAVQEGTSEKPSEAALTITRFLTLNDIKQDSDEDDMSFSERVGYELGKARATLGKSVADVEKVSGLRALGVSAGEMAEAIQSPYGDTAKMIAKKLEDQTRDQKSDTREMQRAVQRLDDVANPKTKAELLLERDEPKDPTKLEDEKTRAEREDDIRAREAGEKLKDVQKVQDAVADINKEAAKTDRQEGENAPADEAVGPADAAEGADLLLTLAAGVENAKSADKTTATDSTRAETSGPEDQKSQDELEEEQLTLVALAGNQGSITGPAVAPPPEGKDDILVVAVDEIGIYDLLKHKTAKSSGNEPAQPKAA
ncbi:hypothetical protein BJF93_04270 [Xaviernesmea oryzae]|uniref:Uncharacterized protein n=1 Tax=Xaviernesmea oryzae TaxID=464029 RepID=A0A1Q9AUK1_9HYPH|nr:hypothetical protein [Xaviernesmea oryzae]OLP59137.1 hypothetical protein BJF93_04270 [Xaviernesmea oryzae]SEK85019.1 hypothetical protein SAMN04487976_104188 [Xaviernesmea oryzae]